MPISASNRNSGAPAPKKPFDQIQGLNHLRFLAALLVFIQHSLSSSNLDSWIDVGGWRIGRIGTALFFLLSGFLSAKTTRKPLPWFRDRLVVLFPPFWIVTIIGFILAALTGAKSFDLWQVVSQLGGAGYFTHGDHMINVATWFMSPLILLYLTATLARVFSVKTGIPILIVTVSALALKELPEDAAVYCHAATFFLAFAVGMVSQDMNRVAAMMVPCFMILLACFQPEFKYGALASLLLIPALHLNRRISICNHFSRIAYEWFLVHGLCLSLMSHVTTFPLAIALVGAGLSIVAAIGLQRFVRVLASFLHSEKSDDSLVLTSGTAAVKSRFPAERQAEECVM